MFLSVTRLRGHRTEARTADRGSGSPLWVVTKKKTRTTGQPEGLAGAVVAVGSRHAEADLDLGGTEEAKNEGRASGDGMSHIKMELVVPTTAPMAADGGIGGFSMMPAAGTRAPLEFERIGAGPTTSGGDVPAMMDTSKSGAVELPKPAVAPMGTITSAAEMMLPRVAIQGPEAAGVDPRIHKELNEIIGKKQQELQHVQIVQPPPLKVGTPSAHAMTMNGVGVKPPTPQANGVIKASPGGVRGAPTQARAGTRGAGGRGTGGNISKSIEDACQAAAIEDGVLTPGRLEPPPKASKAKNGLRRGKWTPEEESYANRLIVEFKAGLLPLTDGTTLRTFLSKLLNCDPMRISKKFVGQNCIGKQVFRRRQVDMDRLTNEDIERSRQELADLERKFLERVAQTNRCKNTSGISKHPGGKDLGVGQVAPEINRRTQEYVAMGGRATVPGPMIPPWMLPPTSGGAGAPSPTATTSSTAPPSSSAAWDPNNPASRPPSQPLPPATTTVTSRAQGGGGGASLSRRPSSVTTPATARGSAPMPRNDSTDSLLQAAEGITPLSDYPRNSSIGDLASLGIFASGSPFQSTDNLVALAAANATAAANGAASTVVSSASSSFSSSGSGPLVSQAPGPVGTSQNGEWAATGDFNNNGGAAPPAQSGPFFDGSGGTSAQPGGSQPEEARGMMVPPYQRTAEGGNASTNIRVSSAQQLRTMPRVESSTGLSSLRVQGGMPRHGSVEDFLSLVACGDIPAPETNILSNSIFSGHGQRAGAPGAAGAAHRGSAASGGPGGGGAVAGARPAGGNTAATYNSNYPPPAVISFTGIGKSGGVPQGFPGGGATARANDMAAGGVGTKRPRSAPTVQQPTLPSSSSQAVVSPDGGVGVEGGVRLKQPKVEGGAVYDEF